MKRLCCMICLQKFNDSDSVPKVLGCGHNICQICLSNFFQFNAAPTCPKCAAQISKNHSFPTNYALLELSTHCVKELVEEEVNASISHLKNQISNLEFQVKSASRNLNLFASSFSPISKKGVNFVETSSEFSDSYEDDPSIVITRNTDENNRTFLYKIYKSIKQGPVYAFKEIRYTKRYGKISNHGKKIYVNSLTSSFPKNENNVTFVKAEAGKSAGTAGLFETGTVPVKPENVFQDIKTCLLDFELCPFLQIGCNEEGLEVILEVLLTGSPFVNQFVRLCSGEAGPCYRNSPYTQDGERIPQGQIILYLWGYMSGNNFKTGQFDYTVGNPSLTNCLPGEYVIHGNEHGSFGVSKITSGVQCLQIMGKIIDPGQLENIVSYDRDSHRKINECGIVIPLN